MLLSPRSEFGGGVSGGAHASVARGGGAVAALSYPSSAMIHCSLSLSLSLSDPRISNLESMLLRRYYSPGPVALTVYAETIIVIIMVHLTTRISTWTTSSI